MNYGRSGAHGPRRFADPSDGHHCDHADVCVDKHCVGTILSDIALQLGQAWFYQFYSSIVFIIHAHIHTMKLIRLIIRMMYNAHITCMLYNIIRIVCSYANICFIHCFYMSQNAFNKLQFRYRILWFRMILNSTPSCRRTICELYLYLFCCLRFPNNIICTSNWCNVFVVVLLYICMFRVVRVLCVIIFIGLRKIYIWDGLVVVVYVQAKCLAVCLQCVSSVDMNNHRRLHGKICDFSVLIFRCVCVCVFACEFLRLFAISINLYSCSVVIRERVRRL